MGNMQRPYNSVKYGISCIAATFTELLESILSDENHQLSPLTELYTYGCIYRLSLGHNYTQQLPETLDIN